MGRRCLLPVRWAADSLNCASGKVRYRVFYGFDGGRIVVLLHASLKDQRVIEDDLVLAQRRLKHYFDRR
jgi:hypothetical protein